MAVHLNNVAEAPIDSLSRLARLGGLCPQVFFVISSFLLFGNIGKDNLRTRKGVLHFYGRKLARLLPLYIIAVLLFALLKDDEFPIESLIWHLTLLNGFSSEHINDIIGVEWYMADFSMLENVSIMGWFMALVVIGVGTLILTSVLNLGIKRIVDHTKSLCRTLGRS